MSNTPPAAVQQIINQVNTYSALATAPNGVAYSGPIGDVSSAAIAPSIATQLGWSTVNSTARGQFLETLTQPLVVIAAVGHPL